MSDPVETPIQLVSPDGLSKPGTAYIQNWSEAERKKRGIKAWALCWGLAVPSLFLPVAHFFLVPMFVILGPTAFFMIKNMKSKIIEATGTCPHCNDMFKIENQPEKWPISSHCEICRKSFSIDLV